MKQMMQRASTVLILPVLCVTFLLIALVVVFTVVGKLALEIVDLLTDLIWGN